VKLHTSSNNLICVYVHLSNLDVEAVHLLQAVQRRRVFLGHGAGVQMTQHQSVDFREPLRRATGGGGLELNRIDHKRQKERRKVEIKNRIVHNKYCPNVVVFKGANLE